MARILVMARILLCMDYSSRIASGQKLWTVLTSMAEIIRSCKSAMQIMTYFLKTEILQSYFNFCTFGFFFLTYLKIYHSWFVWYYTKNFTKNFIICLWAIKKSTKLITKYLYLLVYLFSCSTKKLFPPSNIGLRSFKRQLSKSPNIITILSTETIIYHNFPSETDAGDCEPPRCARHVVTYDVTMEQIIALIEQSAECRQFIKVFGEN